MSFTSALARLQRDLRHATGVTLIWKDAEPSRWVDLPLAGYQHRQRYCLAVKVDAQRCERCRVCDDLTAADWPARPRPRWRTCPFGVREYLVPVLLADAYQGCAYFGAWRDARRRPLDGDWRGLSTGVPTTRVRAAAALALPVLRAALLARDPRPVARRDPLIHELCERLADEVRPGLQARELARRCGLSPSRFVHRFKEATGQSWRAWLLAAVMRRAVVLLLDPARSITAIALELGYGEPAAFAHAFRRRHGTSPRSFRRRLLERRP